MSDFGGITPKIEFQNVVALGVMHWGPKGIVRLGEAAIKANSFRPINNGRSLRELVNLIAQLEERKIEFVSLKDAIDTSTAHGRFFQNTFASLAEFERDIIRERSKAGLSAAGARGRMGGKKKGLTPDAIKKAETAVMLDKEKKTAEEIACIIGVGLSTAYRYLDAMEQKKNV